MHFDRLFLQSNPHHFRFERHRIALIASGRLTCRRDFRLADGKSRPAVRDGNAAHFHVFGRTARTAGRIAARIAARITGRIADALPESLVPGLSGAQA